MRVRSIRRRARLAVVAMMSVSLFAAACSDSGGSDANGVDGVNGVNGVNDGGAVGDPVAGGTLRYGLEADVDGLNPTSSALSAAGLMMANAVFDTLTAVDEDGETVPFLAESVEPVDGDYSTWVVTVRRGISFHDGATLDADAVIRSFETQLNDPRVGLAVRPFYPESGAVERLDDYSVQFNLLEPNRSFPGLLTGQLGYVASPTWLEAALDDPTLNQQPVGTGPFVFAGRSPDSSTRFVRNEDWWNGEVWLDAIEFIPVPDPDTRTDLLLEGELDALHTTDPGGVLRLSEDDSIQQIVDENGEESFIMLNSASEPFDDIRARQALALATPLSTYRDLIGLGVVRGADQRFTPESPYFNPDVVQEGDDPEGAAELAAEFCDDKPDQCSDGKINMEYQYSGPSVLQEQIKDLLTNGWSDAFNVNAEMLPQDEHILQTASGQYNAVGWRQFGAADPAGDNIWLMCRTISGISLNWPRYCDESRDALLLEGQATEDEERRVAIYQEVSQRIDDDYLYIFLQHTYWDIALAGHVHGICDRVSPDAAPLRCVANGRNWFSSVWMTPT